MLFTARDLISFSEVGEKLSNSDHCIIRLTVNFRLDFKESDMMIPNSRLADFNKLHLDISNADWIKLLDGVKKMWCDFKNKLLDIFSEREKRSNEKELPGRMTEEIKD